MEHKIPFAAVKLPKLIVCDDGGFHAVVCKFKIVYLVMVQHAEKACVLTSRYI